MPYEPVPRISVSWSFPSSSVPVFSQARGRSYPRCCEVSWMTLHCSRSWVRREAWDMYKEHGAAFLL